MKHTVKESSIPSGKDFIPMNDLMVGNIGLSYIDEKPILHICSHPAVLISPFPLSNKLIRMLGFENTRDYPHRFIYKGDNRIFLNKRESGEYLAPYIQPPITALHTLQNWFRLVTGKDLEIDLDKLKSLLTEK